MASEEEAGPKPPKCFLIVHNVSKKANIGTLSRCATAFGVDQICICGSNQFNTFGSHGADAYVKMKHFSTLELCRKYLKEEESCEILGVEIREDAFPVQSQGFKGNTAFIMGNEGQGMTDKQMAICDRFVYIPQYGGGTASLNVAVAASIVLHTFAVWAGYEERSRTGYKFDVADRPQRTSARGQVPMSPEEIEDLRQRRAQGGGGSLDEDGEEMDYVFDVLEDDGALEGGGGGGRAGDDESLSRSSSQGRPPPPQRAISAPLPPPAAQVEYRALSPTEGAFSPC